MIERSIPLFLCTDTQSESDTSGFVVGQWYEGTPRLRSKGFDVRDERGRWHRVSEAVCPRVQVASKLDHDPKAGLRLKKLYATFQRFEAVPVLRRA